MIINGKYMTLADCMIPATKSLVANRTGRKNVTAAEFVWIAYESTGTRLPVAIASTAGELARLMGVSQNAVVSNWSKFLHGKLHNPKYAKVYIGGEE